MPTPKPAAKPAPKPPQAKAKPAAKPSPAPKPAPKPTPGGYHAQKQAKAPGSQPQHVQGATLHNNQHIADPSAAPGQGDKPASKRPAGTFLVNGQPFATLDDIEQWLQATQPQDPQIVIQCTPGSRVQLGAQCLWQYYNPNQKIVLDGQGAEVTGRHGAKPTMGYFLSYRPTIGQQNTAKTAVAANLEVKNLTITGFEAGGVEISPQVQAGKDGQWEGGLQAFVKDAAIHDVQFRDLGNKGTPRKDRVWNNMRFGAGGVVMRGVQDSTIENCQFDNLTNGEHTRYAPDETGKTVAHKEDGNHLMHAVYMNNSSSGNQIRGNTFDGVGGDAVRVSNGSNRNTIAGNTARNSGQRSLVNNWFKPGKGEQDSTGTVVSNNKLGRAHGKRMPLQAYTRKVSKGQQAPVDNVAVG